ncbi:MAG: hypothetical protein Q4F98_01095 [Lachnospiraceae bacterium]|nr:hypothetical protein [Lachnospiraceae bacterium]
MTLKFSGNLSCDFEGTYSAGNEPNNDNVCMVIKNKEFTLYDQDRVLDSGSVKKINLNNTLDVYELVSEDNTRTGYVVPDKNRIVLLGFKDTVLSLKKISREAMYLEYESE